MPRVGRRRIGKQGLPAGVREIGAVWYWQPTTARERAERKANREKTGEPIGCTLGPAGSTEARKRWAEVSGYAATQEADGLVRELIRLWDREGIATQPNGEPRAEVTVAKYREQLPAIDQKFGACRYGKTSIEAARGVALGPAEIQRWVSDNPKKAMANMRFAVLDNLFAFGIIRGRTTYNPCADVVKNASHAREREPLSWEVEALRTLAKPRLGLQMDFEVITGWRIGSILRMLRSHGIADGIKVKYQKRGSRWLWDWSPELRRIWRETESLPGATKFPASPVFPTRTGKALKYGAFNSDWQALKRLVNARLAAGIIDPDTLERHPGLVIENLHFHDLRSKAHDDAEEAGEQGNDFLGNSASVARRHYRRRHRRMRPLK